jgi:HK97 family phage major capsid protein
MDNAAMIQNFGLGNATAIPLDIFSRDLAVTNAGQLVMTEVEKTVAETLLAPSIAVRAGAQVVEGLKSNLKLPRLETTQLPGWVTENTQTSGNNTTFSVLSLEAHLLQTSVTISKQLLTQASPSIEEVIAGQLRRSTSSAIDNAVFNGLGSSNTPAQPLGLLNGGESTSGDSDYSKRSAGVTFGATNAPTWAEVLTLPYNVEANNVESDDSCVYVTSPLGKNRLQKTVKVSSYPSYIWDDEDKIAGRRAFATNNVNTSQLIYGKFSELLIAIYGIFIEADIYSLAAYNQIKVNIFCLADLGPIHGTAFAVSSNSLT